MLAEKKLRTVERNALIGLTSDIALIIDADGTVVDVDVRLANGAAFHDWRGQSFYDLVTSESRDKVAALLHDGANGVPTWRQLNHPNGGLDHPIRYCAVPLGKTGRVLWLGQDMMPLAQVQQQLIEAQEAAEQDYWRLRQAEARFHVLFEAANEPIFVADADARIIEANPAANALVSHHGGSGRALASVFAAGSDSALRHMLTQAQAAGTADASGLALRDGESLVDASASLMRQGNATTFIVRLEGDHATAKPDETGTRAAALLDRMPDGVVIVDERGAIVYANAAFIGLTQLAAPEHAIGAYLDSWLGRSSVDVNVLLANLKKSGSLRAFTSQITGEQGLRAPVEIAATMIDHDAGAPLASLVIRDVSQRTATLPRAELSANGPTMEDFTELVGSVPLKELVRESVDQIERLAISAALKLTEGNRAAAAEMLGLSRQSLYFKLRRYDLQDESRGD